MADNSYGVSFVPGGQGNDGPRQQPGLAGGAPPIQRAIQLLSLRLPRVAGANALAPGPLLNAPGAMGQPWAGLNGAATNPLLQALLLLAGMSSGQARDRGAPFSAGGAPFSADGAPFSAGGAPFSADGAPFSADGAPFSAGGAPLPRVTPGYVPTPRAPQAGPGEPTFPPGGGSNVDRLNPDFGNRDGGPVISDWQPEEPFPSYGGGRGRLNRIY